MASLYSRSGICCWVAVLASGILLFASFPPLGIGEAAWVSLVPLLLAVRHDGPRTACLRGLVCGLVFWILTVSWLRYVTVVGWLLLAGYCSLYVAAFALGISFWWHQSRAERWTRNLGFMGWAAVQWTALEYLRATLFTGFSWNSLAISQHEMIALCQVAEWGGTYVLSGVIVFFNAALAVTILRYVEQRRDRGWTAHPELGIAMVVIAGVFSVGVKSLQVGVKDSTPVQIGLVQPNIPQIDKWTEAMIPEIYRRLREWTETMQTVEGLDLILWPETALPDEVRYGDQSYALVQYLVRERVPLLVGSVDVRKNQETGAAEYVNSSLLFDTSGEIVDAYDKQHLVMFGEYIPFEEVFPFLGSVTPNQASFVSGRTNTVFTLEEPSIAFSTLICFEDTMPYLSRNAVREGARLLINQTNDAWFEQSSAPRQHMSHCVFRCIENRVPAVRCANTGVSCFIDSRGVVQTELMDEHGKPFLEGVLTHWVFVPPRDRTPTFYTRYGDLFALVCLGLGILGWLYCGFRRVGGRVPRESQKMET